MKKFLILPFFVLALFITNGCSHPADEASNQSTSKTESLKAVSTDLDKNKADLPMSSAEIVADKLEVYYFHATARCYSCKTIGRYVKETMEQEFAEQIQKGRIDYREINVDLPENEEIARKFQASGSSLFINRIKDGQDNIEPDMDIWKLLGNEEKFKSHLENKINAYLGL